ncbi:MAG TPA: multicopper oxidase domain-containing protein [Thermoanaerobaculia bacterium]|nr:multicopper oxidase domain-containing protein [Thermoanaerobaculia bacterium]
MSLFVLIVLLSAMAAAAQTETKAPAKAEPGLPPGAVERQGVVIPGCGARGKEELRELTTVRAEKGVLNTKLEVWLSMIKVPALNTVTGVCEDKTFAGRMYRDPVSGVLAFPGPTLRVRRADKVHKGDAIRVLLDNHLPPSSDSEKCVWAKAGSQLCDCKTPSPNPPQCCFQEIEPKGMNCFHGSNTTNLHFHGTHASPQKPQDWVFLELSPPGQEYPHGQQENQVTGQFQYEIDPLNERQPEGTHWYHPHKHGSTAEQVGNGMAGALIVEGPFDDWLQAFYGGKLVEKVMIMQQVHDLNFTSVTRVGRQFKNPEVAGDLPPGTPVPLINGQLVPRITMNPGEVQRWRVISATMEASAQLVIDLDGLVPKKDTVEVRQIAMDGVQFSPENYRCQPLLDPEVCTPGSDPRTADAKFQLSPGNRGDFLVKAPNRPGAELLIPYEVIGAIENQGEGGIPGQRLKQTGVRAQTRAARLKLAPGHRQPALLAVRICVPGVDEGCVAKPMRFPDSLPDLPEFLRRPIEPTRFHNVQFQVLGAGNPPELPVPDGRFGVQMRVKDELQFVQFDHRCANFTAALDSPAKGGEEWRISQNINAEEGAPPFHVFHIHTNPFQVLGTERRQKNGTYVLEKYPEPIWQDSITLPDSDNGADADHAGARVVIRRRIEDYTGAYVLHCHFLGHEDRGMMLMVQAVCPGGNFFSKPGSGPECVSKESLIPALPPCPLAAGTAGHGGH